MQKQRGHIRAMRCNCHSHYPNSRSTKLTKYDAFTFHPERWLVVARWVSVGLTQTGWTIAVRCSSFPLIHHWTCGRHLKYNSKKAKSSSYSVRFSPAWVSTIPLQEYISLIATIILIILIISLIPLTSQYLSSPGLYQSHRQQPLPLPCHPGSGFLFSMFANGGVYTSPSYYYASLHKVFHKLQIWPHVGGAFFNYSLDWHHQLPLSWYHHQSESHQFHSI